MTVQVGFQKSNGSRVHRFICWWTKSDIAHCEVVVDGVGYGISGSRNGLYERKRFKKGQWVFVDVPWDKMMVLSYITANRDVQYDHTNFRARINRMLGYDDPMRDDCAEWVVNIGSYCMDPRLFNRAADKLNPADIYQKLKGGQDV